MGFDEIQRNRLWKTEICEKEVVLRFAAATLALQACRRLRPCAFFYLFYSFTWAKTLLTITAEWVSVQNLLSQTRFAINILI